MESQQNQITLTYQESSLVLDLQNGCKIIYLKFNSDSKIHTLIKGESTLEKFTSNGSFFMYPWVNRLEKPFFITNNEIKPEFLDNNGSALHGLVATAEREVLEKNENYLVLKIKNLNTLLEKNPGLKDFPNFKEIFLLTERELSIITVFEGGKEEKKSQGFSFGYHPYLQLDDNDMLGSRN